MTGETDDMLRHVGSCVESHVLLGQQEYALYGIVVRYEQYLFNSLMDDGRQLRTFELQRTQFPTLYDVFAASEQYELIDLVACHSHPRLVVEN